MHITKVDVLWNFGATFLKIASSALLLPFILHMLPSEEVGVWTIFASITAFTLLLDFGFTPSFTRNITYILSGARELRKEGVTENAHTPGNVDYALLGGALNAMRWLYLRMSLIIFFLLATVGTLYISFILKKLSGGHLNVSIAWALLVAISTYNLYSFYYEALIMGKGLIKRAKQITIIAQLSYLGVAMVLIYLGYGLIAIVCAQMISVVITRVYYYKAFFTPDLTLALRSVKPVNQRLIIEAIYPNAVKIGLTSLGSFSVVQLTVIIGSLYLPLDDLASYGISMQLIGILTALSGVYTTTYFPQIAHLRLSNNVAAIRDIYIKGLYASIVIYVFGGLAILLLGDVLLDLIHSRTHFLAQVLLAQAIVISFLSINHSLAGGILLTKNEVPFFKQSIIAGFVSVVLLTTFLMFTPLGVYGMVLAPGIAHLYNNAKWPYEVFKELHITLKELKDTFLVMVKAPRRAVEGPGAEQ